MKAIPLPELKEILNNKREDALIFEDDIKAIFRKYGDDYYDNYETGELSCVRSNKDRAAYMEVLRNEK